MWSIYALWTIFLSKCNAVPPILLFPHDAPNVINVRTLLNLHVHVYRMIHKPKFLNKNNNEDLIALLDSRESLI
jgi:hypothetical protein